MQWIVLVSLEVVGEFSRNLFEWWDLSVATNYSVLVLIRTMSLIQKFSKPNFQCCVIWANVTIFPDQLPWLTVTPAVSERIELWNSIRNRWSICLDNRNEVRDDITRLLNCVQGTNDDVKSTDKNCLLIIPAQESHMYYHGKGLHLGQC